MPKSWLFPYNELASNKFGGIFIYTIRKAEPEDAGQIVPLMSLIYDEMELEEFESVPDEDPQRMIIMLTATEPYLAMWQPRLLLRLMGRSWG